MSKTRIFLLLILTVLLSTTLSEAGLRFGGQTLRDKYVELNTVSSVGSSLPCPDAEADGYVHFTEADATSNCDGEADLTWDISNNKLGVGTSGLGDEKIHSALSTNGDSVLLLLENSQANSGSSTNETAQLRFGFGGNNDVARIVAEKIADYTSGSAEDSRVSFYTDQNGTQLEIFRIMETGMGIRTSADPVSVLDVEGNVSVGATFAGTSAAPTNGLMVQGQTGIGGSSASSPSILGELTVRDNGGQAALYVRGLSSNSSPAQIYFNDEGSTDRISIAYISAAGTNSDDGRVFEKGFQFNIDTSEEDMRYEFDAEWPISSQTVNKEIGMGVWRERTHYIASGSTISDWREHQFWAPTINGVSGGSAETITNATTFYIDAAPSGSDITFTNGPYALWVDSGTVRFDGTIVSGSDFVFAEDIDIEDATPHLRFTDTDVSSDDYEFYADGNQFYLTNVTDALELFRFNQNNELILGTGFVGKKETSDPCSGKTEGHAFYNDTSDYYCFCNAAGADVQMHSPGTACF